MVGMEGKMRKASDFRIRSAVAIFFGGRPSLYPLVFLVLASSWLRRGLSLSRSAPTASIIRVDVTAEGRTDEHFFDDARGSYSKKCIEPCSGTEMAAT